MASFSSLAFRGAVAAAAIALLLTMGSGGRDVPAASAAGCTPARPHASGTTVESIMSSGGARQYRLHVPPSYTGAERVPLILSFHGLGSNALEQELYSAFSPRADAPDGGFIAVYPQGLDTPLGTEHFNAWQLPPSFNDDVAFTSDVLDELQSELCVDSKRIFSSGMSNGAMMSVRLACSLSSRIAAIAPVAGAYYPPMALNLNPGETCPDTRPAPVLAFHGTADNTVPFLGGSGGAGGIPITFRLPIDNATPDDDVMQSWASHNGCAGARQESAVSAEVRFVSYDSCLDGADVQLYIVDGGGHTWPGAIDLPGLGYTTHDIDATDVAWQFFQAHPLVPATADTDGDTVPNATDDDDDNDGCTDLAEQQKALGSEATGGRRDPFNSWDFYDTNSDRVVDLLYDIFGVAAAYGLTPSDPGYSASLDRLAPASWDDAWDMRAPDGTIDLLTDIFGVARQFGHDCS